MRALRLTLSRRFIPDNAVTTGDEALTEIGTYEGEVMMRFVRRCLMAASYVLVFLGSAQAQSVTSSVQNAVLSAGDSENGNLLAAQSATLTQAATVESLSFYVTAASGSLILGIYDATGPNGGPGALKASTKSFTPGTGWNTATVVTPVSLTAGNYWLAYLPSSNALSFVKTNASGNCAYYGYNFGSLPSKFSTSPTSCTPTTWSFYATLALPATAVNGACGSSNGADLTSAPTTNLCSAGTASTVSGSGPWSWSCAGCGGGTTASCSALIRDQRRMRQRKRGGGEHRADGESLQRRHGVDCRRQRAVELELRRQQWRRTACARISSPPLDTHYGIGTRLARHPASGLLPSDRDASANWKMAGLQSVGGIPNRTTVCATVSPSGGDDTSNIQTAVNNCPSGQVVLLSVGTFTIGEGKYVTVNKSITVRGSGPCAGASGVGSAPYPASPSMTNCTLIQRTGGACNRYSKWR